MSCTCTTNPCSCPDACDAANEAIASQLTNFTAAFFGTVSKTCVNNQVVWALPCDLDAGVDGFPRNAGEGIACYLIRYIQTLFPVNFANTVYVDKNWEALRAVGYPAYATAQEAYDAVYPFATIANPYLIKFGNGVEADFGGITITADWNTYVSLLGNGIDISVISFIDGHNDSGNAYDVNLIASLMTIRMIDTSTSGAFVAGDVSISLNAGTLNVSSSSSLDLSAGAGGTGGNLTLRRTVIGEIIMGTNSPGTIQARFTEFGPFAPDNCIDNLNGGSTFGFCTFRTGGGGAACIANVTSNGAQFTNCLFVPNGGGAPIDAAVARTIVSYNNIAKNANGVNVTLSEGTFTVMVATMRMP